MEVREGKDMEVETGTSERMKRFGEHPGFVGSCDSTTPHGRVTVSGGVEDPPLALSVQLVQKDRKEKPLAVSCSKRTQHVAGLPSWNFRLKKADLDRHNQVGEDQPMRTRPTLYLTLSRFDLQDSQSMNGYRKKREGRASGSGKNLLIDQIFHCNFSTLAGLNFIHRSRELGFEPVLVSLYPFQDESVNTGPATPLNQAKSVMHGFRRFP
ncbi:hypothetical protein RRG08_008323 [Elysia crispata]|uniref:Uncharacterized protein n=1 Tax=Elysia crispata TaxID=231223 RepID=A0AAE0ZNH5_9GAST|nr:hypothetical protein RRG08_008323 [Elysia crispata]